MKALFSLHKSRYPKHPAIANDSICPFFRTNIVVIVYLHIEATKVNTRRRCTRIGKPVRLRSKTAVKRNATAKNRGIERPTRPI
jgi:hypothetical protein